MYGGSDGLDGGWLAHDVGFIKYRFTSIRLLVKIIVYLAVLHCKTSHTFTPVVDFFLFILKNSVDTSSTVSGLKSKEPDTTVSFIAIILG